LNRSGNRFSLLFTNYVQHSLRSRKALSARFGKKLGPQSASNEFFTAAEWYGLRGGGELSA
jgi:hypothetical protein